MQPTQLKVVGLPVQTLVNVTLAPTAGVGLLADNVQDTVPGGAACQLTLTIAGEPVLVALEAVTA